MTFNTILIDLPFTKALIVTEVLALTLKVLMLKLALLDPADTFTVAGTEATAGLLLDRLTTAPTLLDKVTLPVTVAPPRTDEDDSVNAAGVGGATTVRAVVAALPDKPRLSTAKTEAV